MTIFDIAPFIPPALAAQLQAKMEAGESVLFETIQRRKDGTTLPVEINMRPSVHDGKVYVIAVVRDITERKKDEARIKEGDVLKNKFIQIVSHQFRTPLNVIRWNLEALLGENLGPMKPEQKEFIRMTHDADVEVIERVGDLLTAMDIEEKRVFLERSDLSLESLLASVVGGFKHRCDSRGLVCAYAPPTKPLPIVSVDAEKIRSVFEKLMLNAINYTPKNGRIVVSLAKTKAGVRFEITDTGIGIPVAEQPRIFTRFYRASNASAMMPDASGLGLYLAKYLVEQHGGKIGFTSKEGKGSTFWFEVPNQS